jgi:hypothetical protein
MITDSPQKIKEAKALNFSDIFIVLVVVSIGFLGFGLGRLSKIDSSRVPIKLANGLVVLDSNDVSKNMGNTASLGMVTEGGKVVASKTGTKYHLPWCSGARTIKESNKIYFDSAREAEKAGYTKAANCKGL